MGFSPPVPQDDSNWEIRVAVLLSLFLQTLLIFVGPVRKRSSAPFPRFLVWSCYLLADWVADLALGLMLNNMGNIGGGSSSSSSGSTVQLQHVSGGFKRGPSGVAAVTNNGNPIIFAFWTPFLLLHLGGPDTITAYSLEDNELWLRHLIGLLFELFSASVIFFCSLKSNPLVPATVLMFLVGIVKYGERTYSLYSGSVNGFRWKIDDPDPGPNYAKFMTEFDSKEKAGLHVEIVIADNEAQKTFARDEGALVLWNYATMNLEAQAHGLFLIFRRLFGNLILNYKQQKISQVYFLPAPGDGDNVKMTPAKAFKVIEVELNFIYDMVYTKAPVAHTKVGVIFRFLGSACIVSSLLIFFFHGKDGFLRVDVAITYALLLGGLALDVIALLMLLCSDWMMVFLEETPWTAWLTKAVMSVRGLWRFRRWSETASQLNLISYCLGKPDPYDTPKVIMPLAKVANMLHAREIFDDFFFIRRERLSGGKLPLVLEFVFNSLRKRAENSKGKDMKEICGYRGESVLDGHRTDIIERLKQVYGEAPAADKEAPAADEEASTAEKVSKKKSMAEEKMKLLEGSVAARREFNESESLLLWHIATDLCFYELGVPTVLTQATDINKKPISKTLSEYMLYLLIKQPEILSAIGDIGLIQYQDTRAEAQRFFKSSVEGWDPNPNHDDARWMLLNVNTSEEPSKVKGDQSKSVLFDGVILAKTLRELDEELLWEVVAGVWGEMLTYAAGKCRGSTHVKQLSCGGELITMVWLLMVHMGVSDMHIREEDACAKLIVHY